MKYFCWVVLTGEGIFVGLCQNKPTEYECKQLFKAMFGEEPGEDVGFVTIMSGVISNKGSMANVGRPSITDSGTNRKEIIQTRSLMFKSFI